MAGIKRNRGGCVELTHRPLDREYLDMVRYLTARSEQNSVGDNMQLNALQQSNAAKLGNMGYRFNRIEQVGSSIVLKQEVTLLTGKRFELNVATLDASGCVEMHDDVAI